MKQLITCILISFSIAGYGNEDIIIRHDTPDQKYIDFARELPVTSSIVHYNPTDLAGTLIASEWVLSAAHVAETIKDDHKLIIGDDSVGIEDIIIHPGWQKNGRPDLALIKLKSKINSVKPAKLYRKTDEVGKTVIVAGIGDFGTGLTGVEGNPGTMRAATNRVDGSTEDAHFLYWEFNHPQTGKATLLEGISGPGDSSGPAFIKLDNSYFIAGISSGQSTQATDGVEGLYGVTEYYTRVSSFVDWIESKTGDL